VFESFLDRVSLEFGVENAAVIYRIMIEEMGGARVTVPTLKDLDRVRRDDRIRKAFRGNNHGELAIRFDLTETHIRRILANDSTIPTVMLE